MKNLFIGLLIMMSMVMQAQKLNVAIYPYLPRGDQFKEVLSQEWSQLYPDVALNFVDYDCYSDDPPDSLHVFVFDGIFYSYFQNQGFLQNLNPAEISDWDEYMPFARSGVMINNDIYGLPYLGCANVYFFREGDADLDQNIGLTDFNNTIGMAVDTSATWPPPGQGLLINLSGGTTAACLYVNADMNNEAPFNYDPPMPPYTDLNPVPLGVMQEYTLMAGYHQASNGNDKAKINNFQNGIGRTYIGITENSESFRNSFLDSVSFRAMPLAPEYNDTMAVYIDIASINSQTPPDLQEYAVAMVNLMTSYQVMLNSMVPTATNPNPQCLIPARSDVLFRLGVDYPYYLNISRLLFNHTPVAFRLGDTSRTWLNNNKSGIRNAILHPPGYMDFLETFLKRPILDDKGSRLGNMKGGK